jgi:hypothetical protein
MGASPAWAWGFVRDEKIASVRVEGLTLVVEDWGENAPPREGRPPSITELLIEGLTKKPAKRTIPNAVHRGRPRNSLVE